ncbi:MAG TPA: zinc ribbon domain-containing protein [Candidatus Limnocylindrales bacterium]
MAPSVDYPDPEPPPMPTIEAVAAPRPTGPVDSPWERLEAQRTEIETVKPPDELVRPAGPPGIICPACRTENEATRRFCQSCGTALVVTAPVQAVTARPARRSRRWVLILVPLIIVAAVIGFGGAALLKGGLPVASATPSPSGSHAATGSATPSHSASPTASSGVASAHLLTLAGIRGSARKDAPHTPGKSVDYEQGPTTSWLADAKGGRDIWIEVTFVDGSVDLSAITIFPGDQSSTAAYKAAERPHHIQFSADGGKPLTVNLSDHFGSHDVSIVLHVVKTLRITIIDNYPGSASTFSGISEIRFIGTVAP